MAGALTHILTSIAGFLLVWAIFNRYYYGLAFAAGHLAPDVIRFGVSGLFGWTYKFHDIVSSSIFLKLGFTHSIIFWIIFCALIFVVVFLFHISKKIPKKNFWRIVLAEVLFLAGIALHLIYDILIIEKSPWI